MQLASWMILKPGSVGLLNLCSCVPDGGRIAPVNGGMLVKQRKQVVEKAPHRVVLYQMMAQDTRGFVQITLTAAARL